MYPQSVQDEMKARYGDHWWLHTCMSFTCGYKDDCPLSKYGKTIKSPPEPVKCKDCGIVPKMIITCGCEPK